MKLICFRMLMMLLTCSTSLLQHFNTTEPWSEGHDINKLFNFPSFFCLFPPLLHLQNPNFPHQWRHQSTLIPTQVQLTHSQPTSRSLSSSTSLPQPFTPPPSYLSPRRTPATSFSTLVLSPLPLSLTLKP